MTQEIKYKVATKFCGDTFIGDVWSINLDDGPATGECYIWLHSYGGEHQTYDTNNGDILMQYTGIKDKNDKEIYDGFIIQIPLNRKCIVKYAEHISAFVLVEIDGSAISNNILLKNDSACYEIIGNIYENPELLEVANGN